MRCISDGLIQKYVDKETSSKENSIVQSHIITCNLCAKKIEDRKLAVNHIKNLLNSLSREEIHIPTFQKPENHKSTFSIHPKKIIYAASAACILALFLIFFPKTKDKTTFTYLYNIENEYDANLPISDQEMVIEIIDSQGNLTKF